MLIRDEDTKEKEMLCLIQLLTQKSASLVVPV